MDLGVWTTRPPVPTAADNGSLRNDDTAHIGIGVRSENPLPGQTNGLCHVLPVVQRVLFLMVIAEFSCTLVYPATDIDTFSEPGSG